MHHDPGALIAASRPRSRGSAAWRPRPPRLADDDFGGDNGLQTADFWRAWRFPILSPRPPNLRTRWRSRPGEQAERAQDLAMTDTMAISPPPERHRQLLLEHRLDEPADPVPHARLERVEPGRTIKQARFRRRCAILLHGVISIGAQTPSLVVELTRRLRHPRISTHFTTLPTMFIIVIIMTG